MRSGRTKFVRHVLAPSRIAWESIQTPIASHDELRDLLGQLWSGEPQFYDLVSPQGDTLCLGLGAEHGCATFATWLMVKEGRTTDAVFDEDASEDPESGFEFLAGGTPTPVAPRYLGPLETIERIACQFLDTADVPRDIVWE